MTFSRSYFQLGAVRSFGLELRIQLESSWFCASHLLRIWECAIKQAYLTYRFREGTTRHLCDRTLGLSA